jgi:ABC-type amino acid transport substrate-binding protein
VLRTSSFVLEPVAYAFGLPEDSPLREPVNRELLRITESDGWEDLEQRYLGHHD